MQIEQFIWDVIDSNSWLLTEENQGLLIDAVDSSKLYRRIEQLDSLTIILTHSHFDHIYGLNKIRKMKPDSRVICTKLCSEYLGNKYKNMSSSATAFMVFYTGSHSVQIDSITCDPANETFENVYMFDWLGHNIKLEECHGHSADSLIAIVDETVMFSGDTLLPISTVTRFPTGSSEKFWKEDIPKIKNIAVNTVYPGHKSPGQLKDMLEKNITPAKYL